MKNLYINFIRAGFLFFLTFQAFNLVGIFNIKPTFSWEGMITTSLFVWLTLEIIHKFLKTKKIESLSHSFFILGFFPTLVDFFGDILRFYDRFYWYDRAAHFSAAFCLALASFIILNALKKQGYLTWSFELLLFVVFSITLIGGALYEIEEYLEDRLYWGFQLRLGNGPDTAEDIAFDILGGLSVVFLVFIYNKFIRQNLGGSKNAGKISSGD